MLVLDLHLELKYLNRSCIRNANPARYRIVIVTRKIFLFWLTFPTKINDNLIQNQIFLPVFSTEQKSSRTSPSSKRSYFDDPPALGLSSDFSSELYLEVDGGTWIWISISESLKGVTVACEGVLGCCCLGGDRFF